MQTTEITEVRVYLPKNKEITEEPGIKAYSSITLNGNFVIHKVLIIKAKNGQMFIQFPQEKNKETGEFKDLCHPLDPETRTLIQKTVLDKYAKEVIKHAGEHTQTNVSGECEA